MSLIPTENPSALWGYYLAIFGLIPGVGAVLGPGALALGVMGNRAANRDPEVSGKVHAAVAITLGVLETVFNCGGAAWIVVKLSMA